MNSDPIQILSIIKDFNISLDALKSRQSDLLNRVKKTIDNNRLAKIKKKLND